MKKTKYQGCEENGYVEGNRMAYHKQNIVRNI